MDDRISYAEFRFNRDQYLADLRPGIDISESGEDTRNIFPYRTNSVLLGENFSAQELREAGYEKLPDIITVEVRLRLLPKRNNQVIE